MSGERTALLFPTNSQSGGSVVSYTVSQKNCSNVTLKDRSEAQSTKRKLWFAVGLACMFFATELLAGYFANSLGNNHLSLLFFFLLTSTPHSFNVGCFSFIVRRCQFYRRLSCHLLGRKAPYEK